jgi:hypothetical protein
MSMHFICNAQSVLLVFSSLSFYTSSKLALLLMISKIKPCSTAPTYAGPWL